MPFEFQTLEDIRRGIDCVIVNVELPATVAINGDKVEITVNLGEADEVHGTLDAYITVHGIGDDVIWNEV